MIARPDNAAATRRKLRAALALTLATALPAEAQRAREEEQFAAEREALERRGREVLYRGEPLHLVGVASGDPDVLTRTPALASATLGLVRVDREELRARKLAMYDGGERFDTAPRTVGPVAPAAEHGTDSRTPSIATANARDGAPSTASAWPWVTGALAALLFFLRRAVVGWKPRPAAPEKR